MNRKDLARLKQKRADRPAIQSANARLGEELTEPHRKVASFGGTNLGQLEAKSTALALRSVS